MWGRMGLRMESPDVTVPGTVAGSLFMVVSHCRPADIIDSYKASYPYAIILL